MEAQRRAYEKALEEVSCLIFSTRSVMPFTHAAHGQAEAALGKEHMAREKAEQRLRLANDRVAHLEVLSTPKSNPRQHIHITNCAAMVVCLQVSVLT